MGRVGVRIPQGHAAVPAGSVAGGSPALEEFGARAALFSRGTCVACVFAC